MGKLKRFNLRQILATAGTENLIYIDTEVDDSLEWALCCKIPSIFSIELGAHLFAQTQAKYSECEMVHLHQGDTLPFLEKILPSATGKKLIFLNDHSAGCDALSIINHAQSESNLPSCHLLRALLALQSHLNGDDIIIICNAHLYIKGDFQLGDSPEFSRHHKNTEALLNILSYWGETHLRVTLEHDKGYILLVPHRWREQIASWLNILPHDAAGQQFQIRSGVSGVTSISIQRRIRDARFATRYFKGDGIDIGGGGDSLALYREFFPLMQHLFVYDQAHGDGQCLKNVPDESFDFLYSSHCLEHLRDPIEALHSWLRVVKPGGHLVIQMPDEDLYEQGMWPSRFNHDHKLTFTLFKESSWSPVSVNVLDLVRNIGKKATPISLQLVDEGYRYQLQGKGFDQCLTPLAESGIEMIFRKNLAVK